jgi:polyferredoxin
LILGVSIAAFLGVATSSAGTALAASAMFIGATVLMIGFFSRKYNSMIHCTAFCPMGFVVNALGKISPWRLVIDKEKCDHCGACEEVCKYRAISFLSRNKGQAHFQCSLCLDCLPACKKQAITVSTLLIPLSGSTARQTFLTLTVIVHTVFLAFARV